MCPQTGWRDLHNGFFFAQFEVWNDAQAVVTGEPQKRLAGRELRQGTLAEQPMTSTMPIDNRNALLPYHLIFGRCEACEEYCDAHYTMGNRIVCGGCTTVARAMLVRAFHGFNPNA